MSNKNELAVVKNVNELPMTLPDIDKKELFNLLQESKPIADLAGKKFTIQGIMPEMVEVPKNQPDQTENSEGFTAVFSDGEEMVERLRVTLITDKGVYHSFSATFNKALMKAINVFGADYTANTYEITMKSRGSGKGVTNYYVVKVV